MKTNRELQFKYIATINVCGKPMLLSFRETKKSRHYYLHSPLGKVTTINEISRALCMTLYSILGDGKNN